MELLLALGALWRFGRFVGRQLAARRPPSTRSTELMAEILDVERHLHESGGEVRPEVRKKRYEVALASKPEIERVISEHGVGALGLDLQTLREAEDELRAAGVVDWQIRISR